MGFCDLLTKMAIFGTLADTNVALVAQSVEHLHGKEGVIGSSPIEGLF